MSSTKNALYSCLPSRHSPSYGVIVAGTFDSAARQRHSARWPTSVSVTVDDDFVVIGTQFRGFVFRLEGVAVCRDSNFAPIGELEFNGRKNGARFCCAVIDLCVIVRGELRLEGDRGFLRGRGHVDRDADAGGEAVCAFARFKNQVIDTILDVFQRECLAVSGSFALALVIPAAGDLGFVHRQTVLVGRENGAERNVLAHIYAFHRIAAIRTVPVPCHPA